MKPFTGKVKVKEYNCSAKRQAGFYSFLSSALDRGDRSASRPGRVLLPGKEPRCTHWIGGWVSLRAVLDTEFKGKFLATAKDGTPVVQSGVRHYTD
jgi:hypothetical protein